jgi:hypothetical protein
MIPGQGYILDFFQWWLYKGRIIAPYETHFSYRIYIGFWAYPGGGVPKKKIASTGKGYPVGVTVSVAPSH